MQLKNEDKRSNAKQEAGVLLLIRNYNSFYSDSLDNVTESKPTESSQTNASPASAEVELDTDFEAMVNLLEDFSWELTKSHATNSENTTVCEETSGIQETTDGPSNSTGNISQPTTTPEENERAIMSLLEDGSWDEIDTQIPTDEIRSVVATVESSSVVE